MKIGTASLISPSAANTWYGSPTTSTNGLGTSGRPPEIVELARALSNDPDKIYDYVRNNIEITWIYGLQKGGLGAITDKAGTAYDQANLMVELLRQSGYTASYKAGTITLTGAQFQDWSGVSDAKAACQLLSSGGIPAIINGSTNATCAYSGAVTTIQLSHIWVSVTINGTAYLFDPAYKGHVFKTGVADLATTAGLTSGSPMTQAASGMQSGSETVSGGSVGYVKNLNTEALESTLTDRASALQAYIEATVPAGEIEDIVGGQKVARYDPPSGGLRQTTLPYTSAVQKTWTGGIPNQYRTTLRVQITKYRPDTTYSTAIDKTLYVDEIASRKLVFDTNFDTDFNLDGITSFTGNLKLVGEVENVLTLASYTVADSPLFSSGEITLTVNPPYAASANGGTTLDGTYMNGTVIKKVTYMAPLTIVHSWGDVGPGMIGKWGARADKAMPPSPSPSDVSYAADLLAPLLGSPSQDEIPGTLNSTSNAMCENCLGGSVSTMGDGRREQMAVSWMVQSSRAADLHAAIARSIYIQHYSVGVVSADTQIRIGDAFTPGGTRRYYYIVDSFDRVDIDTAFSLTSKSGNATDRRAAVHAIAATFETLEGSISAQIADMPDVSSTSTRFAWGNRPPTAEDPSGGAGPRRFYEFGASQIGQAAGLLKVEGLSTTTADGVHTGGEPEIGSNELSARKTALSGAIDAYAGAGFTVVASEEAFLGPGQRAGAYYLRSANSPYEYKHRYSKQRGGALVATRYVNGEPVEIANVVVGPDGASKGGGGGAQMYHQAQYDPATAADVLKARFKDRSSAMGVDVSSGALSFTSPAGLTVGSGEFPYSLAASLTWTGGDWESPVFGPKNFVPPQNPWTTNWNNSLSMSGSGMEAMGATDVRTSAGTIASFLVMQDIYKATPSSQREAAGSLVAAWWGRQLTGNVVSVSIGTDSRQFVRRFDGQWVAPGPGQYATLLQTGSRAVIAELPPCYTGLVTYVGTRGWDYDGMSFQVKGAQGDVQTFAYWRTDYFDGLSACSKHNGFRLTNWTFPQGVTVTVAYQAQTSGLALDTLVSVSNNLGRTINFVESGLGGFNNGLQGNDLRSVTVTPPPSTFAYVGVGDISVTHLDQENHSNKFTMELVGDPVTEPRGAKWRLTKVYAPDNLTIPAIQYDYDTLGRVKEVKDANALQLANRGPYQFLIAGGVRGERIDPAGGRYSVLYDQDGKPFRYIDEIGRTTSATYDGRGRNTAYIYPEGDQEQFGYDDRNNVTLMTRVAKPGSGLADITTSAVWDTTWNKPSSITDPLGNITTFTYIGSGGGASMLASATRPDPDGAGPQIAPVYQFTYNTKGQVLTATDPTNLVVLNAYDTQGNLTSSRLDPSGLDATTTYTYDGQGDVLTIDGPRTDVIDVSYARYDKLRRKTFDIGPDPDASGALLRPVTRTTYDAKGQVIQVDKGKSPAADGTSFTILQTETSVYDPVGNRIRVNNQAGVTQFAYDLANRQTCAAIRMNPAVYASLPSDACAMSTQGDFGPDRITRTTYDLAGQSLTTVRGYGSPDQQTYATYSYSANGQQATITDARGNRSTMQYDGFDRLCRISFPVATVGANQSSIPSVACRLTATLATDTATAGDFEEYRYDAAGQRSWLRRRDGQVIAFGYDPLGREILKDLPGGSATDVYGEYDGAGRVKSLRFANSSGSGIILGYDSAKRLISEETFGKAMTYQYDLAGNRTRVTWFDGQYAQYSYDALGQLSAIGENGATTGAGLLASFTYDDLGRRTSLTRGANPATTTYSYDSSDRLTALNHNPAGTSFDQTWSYSWNPASQVTSRGATNTAYKWATPTPGTDSKAYDGMNRDAAVVAAGGYDARGNLTADGSGRTFAYDIENRLVTIGGTVSMGLSYDPVGRLSETIAGSATTRFLYDGDRLSAEYSTTGTILRRYVHGLGVDEPLVWYEGAGLTDRRWLHQDAQGSVIAWSNGSGTINVSQVYKYGPWGEPDDNWAAGASRFRYTGQIALTEARLYHYKARVYDPAIGRFLQTDPSGFEDDFNLYAYVGGDPINHADPTGLGEEGTPGIGHNRPPPDDVVETFKRLLPATLGGVVGIASLAGPSSGPVPAQYQPGPVKDDQRPNASANAIREHLTRRDLDAARREARGEVVRLKGNGKPFDHVREVRDAQQVLRSRIIYSKSVLGRPNLTPGQRSFYETELKEASKWLDLSKKYLP